LIPESVVGSVAAPDHEIAAAAIDLKLASRTWLGLQGELLRSKVDRSVGVFDFFFADPVPNVFGLQHTAGTQVQRANLPVLC